MKEVNCCRLAAYKRLFSTWTSKWEDLQDLLIFMQMMRIASPNIIENRGMHILMAAKGATVTRAKFGGVLILHQTIIEPLRKQPRSSQGQVLAERQQVFTMLSLTHRSIT